MIILFTIMGDFMQVSFLESMWLHPIFSLSTLLMVLLFLVGVHRRVVAPSIIVNRTREVLFDFR